MDLRIRSIWRYPVKSIGGEQLDSAPVATTGIVGDRSFGIRDIETGLILTARRQPELLFASATWSAGSVQITLPDGTTTDSDADLSNWLGKPVELVEAGAGPGRYENPMDVENDADWVQWDGPEDTFHDSGRTRASLVSTSSLRAWAPERFRKNFICDGMGEDELVGAHITIGDAAFAVTKRVDRCVMVTRPQPGLERDLSVLKTINAESQSALGIGLTVDRAGSVTIGDAVASASGS